jgi:hypothetical protein
MHSMDVLAIAIGVLVFTLLILMIEGIDRV